MTVLVLDAGCSQRSPEAVWSRETERGQGSTHSGGGGSGSGVISGAWVFTPHRSAIVSHSEERTFALSGLSAT